MSTHKLVTPSITSRSNRAHGAKHAAVYLINLLYYRLLSHWDTLFLYYKGPLYRILLCCLSHHINWAWPLICHIIYFLLTLPRQVLATNAVFANCFRLWNLSCLNICDGFVNFIVRVIIPPIFRGSRGHHLEKLLVNQHEHTMEHGHYFLSVSMP